MEVNAKKCKIAITDVEKKEIAGVEKFLHHIHVQMDNEVWVDIWKFGEIKSQKSRNRL